MSATPNSILIAEDQPLSLDLLRLYLGKRGYDLITAVDGREAIDRLNDVRNSFCVIILDREMPEVDGMQVLAYIKNDPRLKELPVILQTAMADVKSVTEGIAAGAFYYLTKPYEKSVLVSIVDAAANDYKQTWDLRRAIDARQRGMQHLREAKFDFRTLEEAGELAATLASVCPRPDVAVSGLSELLVNAVEHGNLEITYDAKSQLLKDGTWNSEILRRLEDPAFRGRSVNVLFRRGAEEISITITDQGSGFTPDPYLKLDPARITHAHGRGIAMAIMRSFSRVEYRGKGNEVVATIDLQPEPPVH